MPGPSFLADTVIGPHCGLSAWLFDVVTVLARLSHRVPLRRIDRFDRLDFLADLRPLLLTNYPSAQIVDLIERNDARVVYVRERPEIVLQFLCDAVGVPPMEAIRSQTASAVANLAIGRSRHALLVSHDTERRAGEVVHAVARHLELASDLGSIAAVIAEVSPGAGPESTLPEALARYPGARLRAGQSPTVLADAMRASCVDILEPLLAMAEGSTSRPIVWPTSVFTFGDRPGAPPPEQAEIAGPVRNLYYGPYLHLPPARYRVEAILSFSDEITDIPFVLEVHGGIWLAKARIKERRPGTFRGHFVLDHHEPTAAVEIRLRNENPVASGRLSLIEILFYVDSEPAGAGLA